MVHAKSLTRAALGAALLAALSAHAQVVVEDTDKPGNSGPWDTATAQQQPTSTQGSREGTTPTTSRDSATTTTQSGMSGASGAQQSGTTTRPTPTTQSGTSQASGTQSGTSQSATTQTGPMYGTQYGAQPAQGTQSSQSIRGNGSKLPPADARSREAMDAQAGVTTDTMRQSGASATGATAAGTSATGTTTAGATLSKADQKAVRDMAMANMAEVELGRMAQSKSTSEQVKAYAQQMIDDHGQALEDVQALAQAKGVTLPTELDARHKMESARLDKLSGDAFDKAYVARAGVADHRTVHAMLGKIQSSARDPDVKAAADKMKPVVQQHLNAGKQLNTRVRSGKKDDSGAATDTGR